MSVLEGPRKEVRHVIKDGSEHWVEFRDGKIVFADGRTCDEKDVVHLPPCQPTKIICVHVNYISRYYEFNNTRVPPKTPTYFQKPLTALNAHHGELIRPAGYKYVNYEGEMAVVFGKVTRNVTREEAWDCIAGFAPSNDFGCHDFRDTDAGSMLRVKGMASSRQNPSCSISRCEPMPMTIFSCSTSVIRVPSIRSQREKITP